MLEWSKRSKEVAYLLNPAFCGRIIFSCIEKYRLETNSSFPFTLVYLILPLVLHKNTRDSIKVRMKFYNWIQTNPEMLIGFSKRTKELIDITNETLEFLMQCNLLKIGKQGNIEIVQKIPKNNETQYIDQEVKECIQKSEIIGKWFARAGKTEMIYISMGVRP